MAVTISALDHANPTRTRAGARHLLCVPAVRELASNPRLTSIARRFVGPGAVLFRATLFDKSKTSNWLVAWHQDTALPVRNRVDDPEWGPWSVKAGVLCTHTPLRPRLCRSWPYAFIWMIPRRQTGPCVFCRVRMIAGSRRMRQSRRSCAMWSPQIASPRPAAWSRCGRWLSTRRRKAPTADLGASCTSNTRPHLTSARASS